VTKIACRKNGKSLTPVDDEGLEVLARLKDGRDVMVDVTAARNVRQHRLAFSIFRFVKMHCELFEDASIDEIKDAVKLATGFVRRYVDADTCQTFYVCRSISWAACDQTEFNRFFDAAIDVIANRWMHAGITPEDVRRELILMCDGDHAVDRRSA
jgi:hypothetical protein